MSPTFEKDKMVALFTVLREQSNRVCKSSRFTAWVSYICQFIWHMDHQLVPEIMQPTGSSLGPRNRTRRESVQLFVLDRLV